MTKKKEAEKQKPAEPKVDVNALMVRAFKAGLSIESVAWVFSTDTVAVLSNVRRALGGDEPPSIWTISWDFAVAS